MTNTNKENKDIQYCSNCSRSSIDVALLTVILPPIIMEKQDLCHDCLSLAIDSSRNLGKTNQW